MTQNSCRKFIFQSKAKNNKNEILLFFLSQLKELEFDSK